MKANVLAYLTNGNVVRMHVQHPEVGSCENGTHVGIFDHLCWQYAPDDYDDWLSPNIVQEKIKIELKKKACRFTL